MTWSTPAAASHITRVALAQEDLDAAYPIVVIWSGVTEDVRPTLKPRDLLMLQYAEAYQAAWLQSQVDVTGRMDVTQVVQDGAQYSKDDPDAMVLAPLAARCVRRLSWARSRSIAPLTPEQALARRGYRMPGTVVGTEEWLDDQQTWKRL